MSEQPSFDPTKIDFGSDIARIAKEREELLRAKKTTGDNKPNTPPAEPVDPKAPEQPLVPESPKIKLERHPDFNQANIDLAKELLGKLQRGEKIGTGKKDSNRKFLKEFGSFRDEEYIKLLDTYITLATIELAKPPAPVDNNPPEPPPEKNEPPKPDDKTPTPEKREPTGEELKSYELGMYEKYKLTSDPLQKYLREVAGVDPSVFRIEYRTVKNLAPAKKPAFEGQVTGSFIDFSNYHDLLTFRAGLSAEQKTEFDSKEWGREGHEWSGVSIFANNFWDKLDDPNDPLHPHADKIKEIVSQLEKEQLPDDYAELVHKGEVPSPEQLIGGVQNFKQLLELFDKEPDSKELLQKFEEGDISSAQLPDVGGLRAKAEELLQVEIKKSLHRELSDNQKEFVRLLAEGGIPQNQAERWAIYYEGDLNDQGDIKGSPAAGFIKDNIGEGDFSKATKLLKEGFGLKPLEEFHYSDKFLVSLPDGSKMVGRIWGIDQDNGKFTAIVNTKGDKYKDSQGVYHDVIMVDAVELAKLNDLPTENIPGTAMAEAEINEKGFADKITEKTKEFLHTPRGKVVARVVSDLGYRTATTFWGVKSLTDLGLALNKQGDIYEFATGGGKAKKEREVLKTSVEEFFKEYREGADTWTEGVGTSFSAKVKEFDNKIKQANYLSEDERAGFRSQLAKTIWEYRKQDQDTDNKRNELIARATNLYIKKKVSGFRITADALNTAFRFTPAAWASALGYGASAMAERLSEGKTAYQKELLKRESKAVTIGTKAETKPVQLAEDKIKFGEKSQLSYQLKDLLINATVETVRGMAFQGKKKGSKHKGLDTVAAYGNVLRGLGLTSMALSEIHTHGLSQSIDQSLHQLESGDWTQAGHNFAGNLASRWEMLKDPVGTFNKSIGGVKDLLHGGGKGTPEPKLGDKPIPQFVPGGNKNVDIQNIIPDKDSVVVPSQDTVTIHDHNIVPGAKGSASDSVDNIGSLKKDGGSPSPARVDTIPGAKSKTIEPVVGSKGSDTIKVVVPEDVKEVPQADVKTAGGKGSGAVKVIENLGTKSGGIKSVDINQHPDIWKAENIQVGKGGSYYSTFMKQYETNPEYYGYNKSSGLSQHEFGRRLVVEYAKSHGLVKLDASGHAIESTGIKNTEAQVVWQMKSGAGGKMELDMSQHEPGAGTEGKISTYTHPEPAHVESVHVKSGGISASAVPWEHHSTPVGDIRTHIVPTSFENHDLVARAYTFDQSSDDPQGFSLLDHTGNHVDDVEAVDRATALEQFRHIDHNLSEVKTELTYGKNLSLSEQANLARLANIDLHSASGLTDEATRHLQELDKVIAGHGEYLHNDNFANFLKNNYQQVSPAEAYNLYKAVDYLEDQGFKQINVQDVRSIASDFKWLDISHSKGSSGGMQAYIEKDILHSNSVSHLTGKTIDIPLKSQGVFNKGIVLDANTHLSEQINLQHQVFGHVENLVGRDEAVQILHKIECGPNVAQNMAEVAGGRFLFFKTSGHGGDLYNYITKDLHIDLSKPGGMIGERIQEALSARSSLASPEPISHEVAEGGAAASQTTLEQIAGQDIQWLRENGEIVQAKFVDKPDSYIPTVKEYQHLIEALKEQGGKVEEIEYLQAKADLLEIVQK